MADKTTKDENEVTSKLSNKKRFLNKKLIVAFVFILFGLFAYTNMSAGLNDTYQAKKSFERAFNARIVGDCDVFASYVTESYASDWKQRCLNEKNRNDKSAQIREFQVINLSVRNGRAYLQVELKRDLYLLVLEKGESRDDASYVVNYELRNDSYLFNPIWRIDQELK